MLNIDEIRAKAEALRAGEYDGITVYDHAHDLDALCDEVEAGREKIKAMESDKINSEMNLENLTAQVDDLNNDNAVLHRALEISVETVSPYVGPVTKQELCKHYIQRAREETEK